MERSFHAWREIELIWSEVFMRSAKLSWFGADFLRVARNRAGLERIFLRVARNRADLERIFYASREIELIWSEFFTCRAKSNWHGADFSCVARNRTDLKRILPPSIEFGILLREFCIIKKL